MAEHGAHSRIDLETTQRVWNPDYNNQLTEFSDESLFQYEDGTQATPVSLAAEGFLTDFEGTTAGFSDSTEPGLMPSTGIGWEHGSLSATDTPAGCSSGEVRSAGARTSLTQTTPTTTTTATTLLRTSRTSSR